MTARLPRGLVAVSLVAAAFVVVQLARMSVYMVDPAATRWSVAPWNAFTTTHSCLAGYWAAARYVDQDPNVWSDELWLLPPSQPGAPRAVRRIGPFPYDTYEYTPTFLLLPRALLRLTPDFLLWRPIWFALNVALTAGAVWAIARRLVPAAGPGVRWLAPLVLAPMSVLATFQIGNIQLACRLAAILLAARWRLTAISHGQTFWAPEIHAAFTPIVQTGGALAVSIAAIRVARVSPPVASAAGR